MSMLVICHGCGWEGPANDLLRKGHPFKTKTIVWACPQCKNIAYQDAITEARKSNNDAFYAPTHTEYRVKA